MTDTVSHPHVSNRRELLAGACLLGVAGTLAACGNSGNTAAVNPNTPPSVDPNGGVVLGKTTDIPVGGGKVFQEDRVVVTQPTAGVFHAFSAVCTHAQCLVTEVSAGSINCMCHASKFKDTTGAVAGGPAPSALPRMLIVVAGDQIVLFTQ